MVGGMTERFKSVQFQAPAPDFVIDWSAITSHPVRECYPPVNTARFEHLKASLAEKGQLRPVLVRMLDVGTYQLLDGGQRIKAQLELAMPIRFEIVTADDAAIPHVIADANRDGWKGHTTSQRAISRYRLSSAGCAG
jgi:ParB-like nuclease domain